MAESTLSVDLTILRQAVARYLGYGVNVTFSGLSANAQADINAILHQGLRQFYWPHTLGTQYGHRWSFLMPATTLTTSAPYETGTVTIVAGVVTLAGGTFPSWAADGEVIVSGVTYSVDTRDGDTQVTLDDTSVAASAGTTYQLIRPAYTLPDDFGGLLTMPTFRPGNMEWPGALVQVSESEIRQRRQWSDVVDVPQMFALRPKTFDATAGQRYEFLTYPIASSELIYSYTYRVRPNELASTNIYPYGGAEHGETILASCLAAAELKRNDARGDFHAQFLDRLQASIAFDAEVTAPHTLGIDTGSDWEPSWQDMPRIGGSYIVPNGYSLGS